jgi:hypothetical protein
MWIAYRLGAKQVNSEMVREAVADLVVDAKNLEETQPSTFNRIFAPMAPRSKLEAAPNPVRQIPRPLLAVASIFTMLCLVVVPGVYWRTRAYSPPAGGQPTVGTTVAPAPNPSFAPTPVTMTNIFPTASGQPAVVPPANVPSADVVQVATGTKDEILPRLTSPAYAANRFLTVVVEPHVTLRHLSLQYLGRFDPETLAEISRLNPFLTDSSHIEVNAKIRLPVYLRRAARHRTISVADATPGASHQEKP